MRETRVESHFTRRVKGLGGWAVKILPSVSGLPDRMAIMPGGRVVFVELKALKGTVAPHQSVVHRRLASLGCPVEVLNTLEAVDEWADTQEVWEECSNGLSCVEHKTHRHWGTETDEVEGLVG